MAKIKKVSKKNFDEILDKLVLQLKENKDQKFVQDWLEGVLDDLLSCDFFGTEGQCDPRGDHRD